MAVFTGHDLTCIRGERTVFTALDFRLEAGGAIVLMGPNGSGKSSLLRIMAGLIPPAAGTLAWDGEPVADDPGIHRSRLRYVGHADAVKAAFTVAEDLRFWAAFWGGGTGVVTHEAVAGALEAFGLSRLADAPGQFLSAGQRRRLALARALVAPVPLWLLDEPRTALDDEAQNRLDAAVARHRQGGGMIVMATHGGPLPEHASVLHLGTTAAGGVAC